MWVGSSLERRGSVEAAVGAVSFDAKWVADEETAGDREDVGASLAQSIAAPW
jgi:hypothetical protein